MKGLHGRVWLHFQGIKNCVVDIFKREKDVLDEKRTLQFVAPTPNTDVNARENGCMVQLAMTLHTVYKKLDAHYAHNSKAPKT